MDAPATQNAEMLDLLREAVAFLEDSFDATEEVNGSTLVEWFSDWRIRARSLLEGCAGAAGATASEGGRRAFTPRHTGL